MSNSVLANMAIALNLNSQKFEAGIGKAQKEMRAFGMAANKLEGVNLNGLKADFDRQVTSLSQLQKQAREFGKALRLATDEKEIKALNRQLEETYAEMKRIKSLGKTGLGDIQTGGKAAAGSMDNLAGSANQVNAEFARIIQDAPFGMMGIGNNIQQLTSNFGQLQRQAGSTGGAIKAALAAMITPASALTLGIAAITTGWTLYESWSRRSAKSTEEAAKAMKSAEQAADEYVDTLDDLTKARVKGDRDAQQELTTLRLLYKQTQNTALSTRERVKAVDELQKQYPSYFGNLTDEEILAGKAATAYDKLSKSILATARARAAQDLIAEKSRLQLVNEQQIQDELKKLDDLNKEMAKVTSLEGISKQQLAKESFATMTAGRIAPIRESIDATEKQIADLKAQNQRLGNEMLALEGIASVGLTDDPKGSDPGAKGKAQTDYLKQLQEQFDLATKQAVLFGSSYDELGVKADLFKTAMVGLMEQGLRPQDALIQQLKASYDLFASTTLPQAQTAIERFANTDLSKLRLELTATAQAFQALPVQLQPMSEQMKAFFDRMALDAAAAMNQIEISAEQMTSFMQNAIGSAIAGFAESLGALAATGDTQAFFDNLIGIVADFAGNFGKMLIGAGLAALAFESLLANPVAAIAAGAALVAAAGAVKALMSAGPKGSVSAGGGYSSPRPDTGVTNQRQGPRELYFRIQGRDLVAIQKQESFFTQRVGGSGQFAIG